MEINEIETKEIDKAVTKPNVGSIERIVCTHRLHTHSLASTLTLLLRFSCKGKSYQCPAYHILKHSASKASALCFRGGGGVFDSSLRFRPKDSSCLLRVSAQTANERAKLNV